MRRRHLLHCLGVLGLAVTTGCSSDPSAAPSPGSAAPTTDAAAGSSAAVAGTRPASTVEADVTTEPFSPAVCGDGFRTVELDHVVEVRQPESQFDANGSGVAVADLDGDDRLDVVLGNLDGPIRIFWNEGDLEFTPQTLLSGRARAIQAVDVDGDRDLDVVLGPGFGPPLVLVSEPGADGGRPSFRTTALPGVTAPTYSMAWADPDGDGDLDAVVASYDMEFGRIIGGEFLSDAANGAWYLERDGDDWVSTRLSEVSHALALTMLDVDGDGDDDVVVGNDFAVPDDVFLWDGGWRRSELFPVTAANTMSFDAGDVDGDGGVELYATDMAPFGDGNEEFWAAMAEMEHDPPGPQLAENVLLDLASGGYPNEAIALGLDRTGWSWSGRLADLDDDGDLDVYVANGMHPSPLFPVFPNEELREPNLAFENTGDGEFTVADRWRLDTTAGTRGLAVGDLDGDGDLDVVASTVESPALILVNELCTGESVIVETRMSSGNTSAIGARIVTVTERGRQERTIRSGVGYLSADPAAAHFGLGDDDVDWIEIDWPDGERTVLDDPGKGRLRVTR